MENEESFSVQLDVSHFRPEELSVNIIEGHLVIEGKHEEKNDKYGKVNNFMKFFKVLDRTAFCAEI